MSRSLTLSRTPADQTLDDAADDPRNEIRTGLIVIAVFVVLFWAWAASAPLDAAATGVGQISVSGHNQIVQHLEGGVVSTVDVTEGQHVSAGQTLVELVPADVGADVSAARSQLISLEAQRARLTAELENHPTIDWPPDFETLTGSDVATARDAMASQQAQFDAGLGALHAQQAMSARRADGFRQQAAGSQAQLEANARQRELLDQQLAGARTLEAKGFASQNSIRALERSQADLTGAQHQYMANIGDFRQQMAESQLQAGSIALQRSVQAASALRDVDDQLNTLTPKLEAARAQLARGRLHAQTDGVVTGLSVFTPGEVVAPAQRLMEIVPSHPILIVEARLSPSDIQGVHVGQKAEVRFSSLTGHGIPILTGTLTNVSADSFSDEHTGQRYYTAEVTVPRSQLDLVRQVPGADSAIRPGVPVQIMIPLAKRSAFDYLFGPLSQVLWKAFRQG